MALILQVNSIKLVFLLGKKPTMQAQTVNGTPSHRLNRTIKPEASERHREAIGLIQGLVKTIKSYRIYALNNPILKKFVDEVHHKLTFYLRKHGSFRISIDEFKLIFDGEVIYENENMSESLAFLMHRNGLRELSFNDGLTSGELRDFLKTFRSYEILKDSHEDLVTLLWDKEFPNIHFWATDDFLWASIDIPDNMRNIIEKMEMPMAEQKNVEPETTPPFWLFKNGELDEIRKGVPQEMEEVDHINLLMILLEVISRPGEDSKMLDLAVEFLKRVFDRLLVVHDLKRLIKILSFTKILLSDPRLNSKEVELIQRISTSLGEPKSIERLMASLARFKDIDHERLQQYFFLLSTNAIAPLCNAWLRMESPRARMAISNALVELGKQDISTLARFLTRPQPGLVRAVVNVLGKIGKDQCIPYIARVKGHRDPRVRNEALQALSLFNHQDAKRLLITFLDDPNMQVRMNASKVVAKKLGAEALPYLGPIILSQEFEKRELEEKKALLEAMSKIRAPDTVRILEEILHRRSFSKRAEWKEIKSLVESVLAFMDLDEAKMALAKWKTGRRKWLSRP